MCAYVNAQARMCFVWNSPLCAEAPGACASVCISNVHIDESVSRVASLGVDDAGAAWQTQRPGFRKCFFLCVRTTTAPAVMFNIGSRKVAQAAV